MVTSIPALVAHYIITVGRQRYATQSCTRCGGKGIFTCWRHIEAGRCFRCGGSGLDPHTVLLPEAVTVAE